MVCFIGKNVHILDMHVQRMLEMSRGYTLAEILSNVLREKIDRNCIINYVATGASNVSIEYSFCTICSD